MKKIFIPLALICLVLFYHNYCNAQKNTLWKRNTFYAEGATKAPVYSINYDRIFGRGNTFTKTYHAGFSIYNNILAVALGLHFFTGQKKHHADVGLTVMPYVENYKKLGNTASESDKKINIITGAGYRYQKQAGGFFCKVLAGPILALDPPSDNFWKMEGKLYAGMSIAAGFSF